MRYWAICLVGNIFFLPLSLPLLSPIKLNDVLEVVCPLQPLLQPRGGKSGSPLLGGGNDDDDDNKMGASPGFLKRC